MPVSNGKAGVIGYCSGGRQSFLAAASLPLDAAVDCYGAFIVGTPPEGLPLKVGPIVHLAQDLSCPLLGLFGADDQYPSPDQVAELDKALTEAGKDARVPHLRGCRARLLRGEPARLPPGGRHGRLAEDLGLLRPLPGGLSERPAMCTYLTEKLDVEGSGKGAAGWFTLSQATVYLDHPQHAPAEHTLNIDFLNPQQGPSARVAVELTAQSARALAAAIESALAAAPPGLV